ncbi:hypothetical protein CL658_03535 [bacterium]|nr:hypothetical protein [bacterium]
MIDDFSSVTSVDNSVQEYILSAYQDTKMFEYLRIVCMLRSLCYKMDEVNSQSKSLDRSTLLKQLTIRTNALEAIFFGVFLQMIGVDPKTNIEDLINVADVDYRVSKDVLQKNLQRCTTSCIFCSV